MVGESRVVFTKRVLDKNRINGVMCENQEGWRTPLPFSADAHA